MKARSRWVNFPYLLVWTTTGFCVCRVPKRSLMVPKNTNENIAKMVNPASISFWCLRKTLNGLAMEVYPSKVGVFIGHLGLTSLLMRMYW